MRLRRYAAGITPGQMARRPQWEQYLAIGAWHHRRRAWVASDAANTTCPGCGTPVGPRDDVHHLAYPDIPGGERDGDLVLLCRGCHEAVHAALDASPVWRRIPRRAATWRILTHRRVALDANSDAPARAGAGAGAE